MEGSPHENSARIALECQICLALPSDPVATACGHLFCWPCLHRWLQGEPKPCPVCRAVVRKDVNVTPIYGGHGEGAEDVAASDGVIPPRPKPPSPSVPINLDGTADRIITLEQIISGSVLAVTTLVQINDQTERARSELRMALEAERARVNALSMERQHLTASVNYLRRRNYVLNQEVQGQRARQRQRLNPPFCECAFCGSAGGAPAGGVSSESSSHVAPSLGERFWL